MYRCECGTVKEIQIGNVGRATQSCGCLRSEIVKELHVTHGHRRDGKLPRTYKIWKHVTQRCTNPKVANYEYYGGRGIKMCERWADYENFLADMGECPDGLTIDRIDVNGDYEPGNCRWVSMAVQGNNKRNNVNLTLNGVTMTQMQWAKHLGVSHALISKRRKAGLPIEQVLAPLTTKRTPTAS